MGQEFPQIRCELRTILMATHGTFEAGPDVSLPGVAHQPLAHSPRWVARWGEIELGGISKPSDHPESN